MMRLLTLSYCSSSARTSICAFGSFWPRSKLDEAVGTFGTVGTPTHGRIELGELGRSRAGRRPNTTAMAVAQISATRQPCRTYVPWPSVNRSGHYPSSWYRSTTKPVSPPASTGNHAAAAGCSRSALLKSSVTLDNT